MFNFTKNERKGIFVLLVIIILVLITPRVYRSIYTNNNEDNSEIIEFIEQFEKKKKTKTSSNYDDNITKQPKAEKELKFSFENFNPNTVEKEKLMAMGLTDKLSSTIDNYRNAGGVFYKKEDMKKIYGISDIIYKEIEPYIVIEAENKKKQNEAANKQGSPNHKMQKEDFSNNKNITLADTIKINLNKTDSIELTKLRGIGQVFGSRIIKYRDFLGGFYTESQLLEVFGMDSTRYMNILDNIFIDGEIKKINLNNATFRDLVSHPYINRNLANSLVKIREWHGEYKDIEDIKKSDLIDTLTFNRIKHYLTVEL